MKLAGQINYIIILLSIFFIQCSSHLQSTNPIVLQDSIDTDVNLSGIWQLDKYPDSMLIHRDIDKYSGWNSSYAYNLEFFQDSCLFTGWNESAWMKILLVGENENKTDQKTQFWEIRFLPDQKLLMREIIIRKNRIDTGEYYPYHKVNNILTQKVLMDRIANQIFAGTYKVILNDTLDSDREIILDGNFNINGVKGISQYYFETAIDIDYPVPNYFVLKGENAKANKEFSFSFSGDTLLLKNYEILHDNDGDFNGFKIADTKVKLLKNK